MSVTQSDKYHMDGHKLHWHLETVAAWLRGERIPPLHIDAGLSKSCNVRCHYCFGAMQGNLYKAKDAPYFPRDPLMRYMREAGEVGVKSIAFIGEAEPLINPHVYEAIITGKKAGVDIGLGTNGQLYDTGAEGEAALEHLTFLRFNVSAASDEAYRRLHGSKGFPTFLEKVRFCVETKRKKNLPVTIGFQMVLTPQDADQVIPLTELARDLGVDYLEIKHCGDTKDNALNIYKQLDRYDEYHEMLKRAEDMSTDDYSVIVKWKNIRTKGIRDYNACYGAPFLLYSSGDGKLYHCGMYFDYKEEEYRLGDMVEQGFKAIVESDRYWAIMEKVRNEINVHKTCYTSCKTNAVNSYLWKLKNPPAHVNFI